MPLVADTVPAPPALIAQAPAPERPALPATAAGVVVDAETNRPVAGALVQQAGTVSSTFTDADGRFRLLLEPRAGASLSVSAVGYEVATVSVGRGVGLRVALSGVDSFLPAAPIAPAVPLGTSIADTAPLNSHILFAYRFRHQTLAAGNARISGFANNDFRLGARFRWLPWLVEAEGAHFETPVDVAGLPREENPAFSPSTWQFGGRLGYLWAFTPDLEAAGLVGYRYHNIAPNNAEIPYTGSPLDFEQTRHMLGPVGTLAYRPGRGPWHYEGALGLYPVVRAWADAPGTAYAEAFLVDARAGVSYEVVRGLRVGLGYQAEAFFGAGSDVSHLLGLRLHYTPGGVPASALEGETPR